MLATTLRARLGLNDEAHAEPATTPEQRRAAIELPPLWVSMGWLRMIPAPEEETV